MKIYKHHQFSKWMKKVKLTDSVLKQTVMEINEGLVGARLGGNIIKKRISFQGKGKRSSARTIVIFKKDQRSIFIYGFAKNEKANISASEERQLKKLAKVYLSFDERQIHKAITIGNLIEVI